MELYDEEGEIGFIIGLTFRSGQTEVFKADLLNRWHNARKWNFE